MMMNGTRRGSGEQLCHEIALFVAQDLHKYEHELLLAQKNAEGLAEREQQAQRLLLLAQAEVSRQHVRDMAARLRQEQEMALQNEQLDERVQAFFFGVTSRRSGGTQPTKVHACRLG